MKFTTFLRDEVMPVFFISVTCITLLMAVAGSVIDPGAEFGYGVLFSPFVYGLAASVIQLINYSRKELTARQALTRKILHLLALEAGIMGILFSVGGLSRPGTGAAGSPGSVDTGIAVSMALSVFAVYLAVAFAMWALDKRSCGEMNKALRALQDGK